MKKYYLISFFILLAVVMIFLIVQKSGKPTQTIEKLKFAFKGESNASNKYAKYAVKAKEEGFDSIAKLFEAASKAEFVHAGNHKKVLEKLGVNVEQLVLSSIEVKSTKENLEDAIKGESYEVSTMYPEFIKIAESENSDDAKKTFTWALDTEKKHKEFYQKALDSFGSGTEKQFAAKWYVCPVCGNTYDDQSMKEFCDFCMTKKEKFFMFG